MLRKRLEISGEIAISKSGKFSENARFSRGQQPSTGLLVSMKHKCLDRQRYTPNTIGDPFQFTGIIQNKHIILILPQKGK